MFTKDITKLSDKFSELLTEVVGKANIAKINAHNEGIGFDTCRSHDYCDPNQVMIDAFVATFGREPEINMEFDGGANDSPIMDVAWTLSRINHFNVPSFKSKISLFGDIIPEDISIYDSVEIHPCMVVEVVNEQEGVEQCEEEEAQFWSVYLHLVAGGIDCIADCDTKQSAVDLELFINKLVFNK